MLQALWPDFMSIDEVLQCIAPAKNPNFFGVYEHFVTRVLPGSLEPAQLRPAYNWVSGQASAFQLTGMQCALIDALLLKGLTYVDDEALRNDLARAVYSRLRLDDGILGRHGGSEFLQALAKDDQTRRKLLSAIVPLLTVGDLQNFWPGCSGGELVTNHDFDWLVGVYQNTVRQEERHTLAHLIGGAWDRQDVEAFERIYSICERDAVCSEVLGPYFRAVDLDSEAARRLREYSRRRNQPETEGKPGPDPRQRIVELLDRCECGDIDGWWHLNLVMTMEQACYGNEIEPDLRKLPGWKSADAQTRIRIVGAAKTYVLQGDPQNERWIGTNTFFRPAAAGYRGLRLLREEEPHLAASLEPAVWAKWAAAVVAYPVMASDAAASDEWVLKTALSNASAAAVRALDKLLDKENERGDVGWILQRLECCESAAVSQLLISKVACGHYKPASVVAIVKFLLKRGHPQGRALADRFVRDGRTDPERLRDAARMACMLIENTGIEGWHVVWSGSEADTGFRKELLLTLASGRRGGLVGQLSVNEVTALYAWMLDNFPPEAYQFPGDVALFRDSLLRHLADRGDFEACEALEKLSSIRKDSGYVKYFVVEARQRALEKTWVPINPEALVQMCADSKKRYVQGPAQLAEVILESLERLDQKLQGTPPSAPFLWDGDRPKDEHALSDFVYIHLDADVRRSGIILNREVQLRRGHGGQPGERTDIHVDAIASEPAQDEITTIRAVIEVKGCWNSGLRTAMRDQLVGRYLADSPHEVGIYLVGWFYCEQWDENDDRKRRCRALSLADARESFSRQAEELSRSGKLVRSYVLNAALR